MNVITYASTTTESHKKFIDWLNTELTLSSYDFVYPGRVVTSLKGKINTVSTVFYLQELYSDESTLHSFVVFYPDISTGHYDVIIFSASGTYLGYCSDYSPILDIAEDGQIQNFVEGSLNVVYDSATVINLLSLSVEYVYGSNFPVLSYKSADGATTIAKGIMDVEYYGKVSSSSLVEVAPVLPAAPSLKIVNVTGGKIYLDIPITPEGSLPVTLPIKGVGYCPDTDLSRFYLDKAVSLGTISYTINS